MWSVQELLKCVASNLCVFQNGTGVPGYNPFTNDEKRIPCTDQGALEWLQGKVEKAMLHLNQNC
jgi:hypothetical protein